MPAAKKRTTRERKTAAKKAPARKRAVKKAPARKRAVKKAPARKRAVKKAPARKRAVKKAPARKRAVKKAPARKRAASQAKVTVKSTGEMRPMVPSLKWPGKDLSKAYLESLQCKYCGQVYAVDPTRRSCSRCMRSEPDQFRTVRMSNEGEVWVYTIVHQSFPGVPTPFVGAIIDVPVQGQPTAKLPVRANVIGVDPDPTKMRWGMKVRMRARKARQDREGNDVVLFEYVPA